MATRAIDAADEGNLGCQLSSWRELFDARFVAAWDDLAGDAVDANAFNESWLLRPALAQFDKAEKARIFTLWDGDLLCGLMPVAPQTHYGRWRMAHVQNWLHHNAFLGTPLVRTGYESRFWQLFLERLDRLPQHSVFAHLNCLALDGGLATALEEVCRSQKRRFALVQRAERALLERGLSPAAYLENAVRAKKRKELRRQKNRLAEAGSVRFSRIQGDSALKDWTEEFLALEMRGWKGGEGSALACTDETRSFFADALAGAAAAGRLERLDLRLNGKPLAMLISFLCAPGSFSFKTAFDEDYARFSPGVLLQIENLALLERPEIAYCDSCASEGHPMIDSLWTGRRAVGRYSVAIGGSARRAIFGAFLAAELAKSGPKSIPIKSGDDA